MHKIPSKFDESCNIAYIVMLKRKKYRKKLRCGFKDRCQRVDKGRYLECG